MSKKKKDIKPLFCEVCGISIKHPNRRFCDAHRRTHKQYMDELMILHDKRCPKCGILISHLVSTCVDCRPNGNNWKNPKPKPAEPVVRIIRKLNEPQTDDEIRAWANRATDRILAKLETNEKQIAWQLKCAKIRAGVHRTKMHIPSQEQLDSLNKKQTRRIERSGEPNYQAYL